MNQVERAGLARKDVGAVQLAQRQRPKPERIAHADDLPVAHDHQRKRPLHLAQRREHPAGCIRLGQQMEDDLAIDGRLKNRAVLLQFLPQHRGIDQVAVMPDGHLAAPALTHERLRVLDIARPVVE